MRNFMMSGSTRAYDVETGTGTGGDPAAAAAASAAAASAAAAAAAAGGAKPWFDGADAETVGFIQSKGWHDKAAGLAALEAVKSYREAQGFIGAPNERLIKLPADAADEAGWKAAYAKLGVPADAKDYDFTTLKFADGAEPTPEFTDWLRNTAHSLNISKDAAGRLGSELAKYLDTSSASEAAERTVKLAAEHKLLDDSWGANKEGNLFVAKKGAEKLGFSPEHVDALEKVVGYSKIMEALRKVGELSGEANFINGGHGPNGAGGIMTREQAASRISELKKDTAWVARYLEGGNVEAREMTALTAIVAAD